jgi:hypothetical protein
VTDSDWAATAKDIHDISQLKYRYLRALDTKDWDLFATCFVPETTGDYNGLKFDNSADLVEYMRSNMVEGMLTLHQAHHPEISVDGDTATGHWYLVDKVIVESFKFVLEGAAFYSDRYVRTDDGWRISHTGYRRTFEQTYSLDDLPSMKIGGPGTATYAETE